MSNETITVPVTWLDRLFGRAPEQEPPAPQAPPPAPTATDVTIDQFAAIQSERDDLAARLERLEIERTTAARVARFETELAETSLAEDEGLPALLAGLPDETAAELLRRFKALAEQARVAALTADVGHEGQATTGDPVTELDAAVKSLMQKDSLNYTQALNKLATEQPDVLRAAYGR